MKKLAVKKPRKLAQSQKDKWTAKEWYAVELELSNLAYHRAAFLSKKQREILYYLSELAAETGDRLAGWSPETQAEYFAKCAEEDAAMVARRTPKEVAAFAAEEAARDAKYEASRRRSDTRVSRYKEKKKKPSARPVQLELAIA